VISNKLALVAVAVLRDAETNQISVFSIMEQLSAAGIPFYLPNASFYALWHREASDPTEKKGVFTVSINGSALHTGEIALSFGDALLNRTLINVNGIVIPQAGRLRFLADFGDGLQADFSIDVVPPAVALQMQQLAQIASEPAGATKA
jgi:hypothetical protein